MSILALASAPALLTMFFDDPQQPSKNVVTLTTTVSLGGGAQTRALTEDGVKTFAAGEQIALVYQNTSGERVKVVSDELTAGDITSGGKTATFTFEVEAPDQSEAVTRSAAGLIYVAIQPISSASNEVTATDGTTEFTKSLSGKTYEASNGYSLSWRMTTADLLPGIFSVSDGQTVKFAKGNLQATYDGISWTWKFADNQWSYIGSAAGNTSVTATSPFISDNGTVDLFGWVGASSTWDGVNQYGITNAKSTLLNLEDGYGNGDGRLCIFADCKLPYGQ